MTAESRGSIRVRMRFHRFPARASGNLPSFALVHDMDKDESQHEQSRAERECVPARRAVATTVRAAASDDLDGIGGV
jgi:hypothetical protein